MILIEYQGFYSKSSKNQSRIHAIVLTDAFDRVDERDARCVRYTHLEEYD